MAFFKGGDGGFHRLDGSYVPYEPVTHVLCDGCGAKELPLKLKGEIGRHWDTGYKWAPRFGGRCHSCKEEC